MEVEIVDGDKVYIYIWIREMMMMMLLTQHTEAKLSCTTFVFDPPFHFSVNL